MHNTPAVHDRPSFPTAVDSTMLSAFTSCPQKMYRSYIQHWKPNNESVHLVAGKAFAAGIEAARVAYFTRGLSPADAEAAGLAALVQEYGDFRCPVDSPKSLERMCGALEYYFNCYPLNEAALRPVMIEQRLGVEFSFAQPLDIAHPETGDPILYTGRADMLTEYAGQIWCLDEKTTSSLGLSWSRQWDMRSQFTGYCWAGRQIGLDMAGGIVRGVSILKTKFDTQEVFTPRSRFMIDQWYTQTLRNVERMIKLWREDYWDYNLNEACQSYGGCSFQSMCQSPEPDVWLPTQFVQRVWDPLKREEVKLTTKAPERNIPLSELF